MTKIELKSLLLGFALVGPSCLCAVDVARGAESISFEIPEYSLRLTDMSVSRGDDMFFLTFQISGDWDRGLGISPRPRRTDGTFHDTSFVLYRRTSRELQEVLRVGEASVVPADVGDDESAVVSIRFPESYVQLGEVYHVMIAGVLSDPFRISESIEGVNEARRAGVEALNRRVFDFLCSVYDGHECDFSAVNFSVNRLFRDSFIRVMEDDVAVRRIAYGDVAKLLEGVSYSQSMDYDEKIYLWRAVLVESNNFIKVRIFLRFDQRNGCNFADMIRYIENDHSKDYRAFNFIEDWDREKNSSRDLWNIRLEVEVFHLSDAIARRIIENFLLELHKVFILILEEAKAVSLKDA